MSIRQRALICALAAVGFSAPAFAATTYSGITFPGGDASFADRLIASTLGDGVSGTFADPNAVLGVPDYDATTEIGSFSLGLPGQNPDNLPNDQFGSVTIQFTDNSLTTSGDSAADLFIFEIGNAVERYAVEISKKPHRLVFGCDCDGPALDH